MRYCPRRKEKRRGDIGSVEHQELVGRNGVVALACMARLGDTRQVAEAGRQVDGDGHSLAVER